MIFRSNYENIHEGGIMDDKIKILWLSPYPPVNSDRTAGGHTFRTYYNAFKNDEKFDVRLITKCHYKQIDIIREQLSPFHGVQKKIQRYTFKTHKYRISTQLVQ